MTDKESGGEERIVEIVAKALYESHIQQLLEAVSKRQFDFPRVEKFFKSCRTETDRAVPILVFSFFDETLEKIFMEELNPKTPGGLLALFEGFGPLATANARIKMLVALNWISEEMAKELDLLRRIRNIFAHEPFIDGFGDRRVKSLIDNMGPREEVILKLEDFKSIKAESLSRRKIYMMRACLIFVRMVQELLSAPTATRMGLHPGTALGGFDKMPPNLQEAARAGAGVFLDLLDLPAEQAKT